MPSSSLAAMTWHPSRDLHAQTPGCDACPPALQRALLTKAVINTHPSSGIQPTAWSQLHPGHVLQVQQPGQAAPRGARFSQAIREVQHIVFVVSRLRQEVIEPRVLHAAAHSGSARSQWQCGAGALRRRTSTTTWHVEHASEPSQAPAHHAEHQQARAAGTHSGHLAPGQQQEPPSKSTSFACAASISDCPSGALTVFSDLSFSS